MRLTSAHFAVSLTCVLACNTQAQGDTQGETGTDTDAGFVPEADCAEQTGVTTNLSVDPGTWPTEVDAVTEMTEWRIDTVCEVSSLDTEAMQLSCQDASMMPHVINVSFDSGLASAFEGLTSVHLTVIHDTWHDVTMFGQGDWVSVRDPNTDALLAASMVGGAEFLATLPPDDQAPAFYAPLTVEVEYEVCQLEVYALHVSTGDASVRVPAPSSATLDTGAEIFEIFALTLTSAGQGPENPSFQSYAFVLVSRGSSGAQTG